MSADTPTATMRALRLHVYGDPADVLRLEARRSRARGRAKSGSGWRPVGSTQPTGRSAGGCLVATCLAASGWISRA